MTKKNRGDLIIHDVFFKLYYAKIASFSVFQAEIALTMLFIFDFKD